MKVLAIACLGAFMALQIEWIVTGQLAGQFIALGFLNIALCSGLLLNLKRV